MKFNFRDCKKIFLVTSAVIMMGLSLSFLVRTNLGEDPYSFMNLCISSQICWTLGNWQAFLNSILLLIVFFIGRHQIGIDKYKYGNIKDLSSIDKTGTVLDIDVIIDDCKDCSLLPICMGKCSVERMIGKIDCQKDLRIQQLQKDLIKRFK